MVPREATEMETIQQNKAEIERVKLEAEYAEREGNYEKVAMIRSGRLE